ncbi:MAG: ATP-binding cassette domain-containing protein [Clostridia bacterium]|nr:ATP-binding cassette domain-containing protein [Clostridia bacterium]
MISFVNVFVKYTKEFYALSNINLKAEKGEVVALLGPKDSGKTCLLRLLAGLEKQDKGEIYVKDIPIEKIDYQSDISMGYIPYKANFFDKKSVYDNLKYVLEIRKTDKGVLEETINKAIIDFRLESIADEKVYKLSLFQKYLVSIARLSFRKLDIVLIDNIFEELSAQENKELLKLFKKYFVNKNTLVLVATSDEKIAKNIATRVVNLEYGAITKEFENK